MKNMEDNLVTQLVSFKVADEEFGINILLVQEIIRMVYISTLPTSPDYVKGVVELRNSVIPVIDMRLRLGIEPAPYDNETRIIVINDDDLLVGLLVDAVCEVIRIDKTEIENPPSLIDKDDSSYIVGVSKLKDRLLILLDVKELLNLDSFKEFLGSNESLSNQAS